MKKRGTWFISFLACLILTPIASADEGDIGRPHSTTEQVVMPQTFG